MVLEGSLFDFGRDVFLRNCSDVFDFTVEVLLKTVLRCLVGGMIGFGESERIVCAVLKLAVWTLGISVVLLVVWLESFRFYS